MGGGKGWCCVQMGFFLYGAFFAFSGTDLTRLNASNLCSHPHPFKNGVWRSFNPRHFDCELQAKRRTAVSWQWRESVEKEEYLQSCATRIPEVYQARNPVTLTKPEAAMGMLHLLFAIPLASRTWIRFRFLTDEISVPHGDEYEDGRLLGYCGRPDEGSSKYIWNVGQSLPNYRRNVSEDSSLHFLSLKGLIFVAVCLLLQIGLVFEGVRF
jgi:hypothetical protein